MFVDGGCSSCAARGELTICASTGDPLVPRLITIGLSGAGTRMTGARVGARELDPVVGLSAVISVPDVVLELLDEPPLIVVGSLGEVITTFT